MSFEKKEVNLKVNKELYKAIEEYSAYSGDNEEKVIDFIVNRSLEKFKVDYEKLKKGYVEMGNINLEISNAFKASENEALEHIEY